MWWPLPGRRLTQALGAGVLALVLASFAEGASVGGVVPASAPVGTAFELRASGSGFDEDRSYEVQVGAGPTVPCDFSSPGELRCGGVGAVGFSTAGDVVLTFNEAGSASLLGLAVLRIYEVPSVVGAWVAGTSQEGGHQSQATHLTLAVEGQSKLVLNLSTECPLLGTSQLRVVLPDNSSVAFTNAAFDDGRRQITGRSPSLEGRSEGLTAEVELALNGIHFFPTGVRVAFRHMDPLRIFFLFDSDISVPGHAYNANLGRLELQQLFGERVHTHYDILPSTDPRNPAVIWKAIAEMGCRLIVGTVLFHQDFFQPWFANESQHGVRFFTMTGTVVHPAHSVGRGQEHQTGFLMGLALGAGAAAHGFHRVGVMAGMAVGWLARLPNAILLGVMKACPDCKVDFMTTGSYSLKDFAGVYVQHFIDRGVKGLSIVLGDNSVDLEAVQRGLLMVSFNADMVLQAGSNVLASHTYKWTSMLESQVVRLLDGDWQSFEDLYLDLAHGGVELLTLSPKLGVTGRSLVLGCHQKMLQGWGDIFCPEDYGLSKFVAADAPHRTIFEPTAGRPCMRPHEVNDLFQMPWVRVLNQFGEALTVDMLSTSCPPGTRYNASGSCENCTRGTYQPQTLAGAPGLDSGMACADCPSGHFCPEDGMQAPAQCEIGFFARHEGQTACELCRCTAGQVLDLNSEEAASGTSCPCVDCAPGTHATSNGTCTRCEVGFFQPAAGQVTCQPCGGGRITAVRGAHGEEECVCRAGEYDLRGTPYGDGCKKCPGVGIVCGANATLAGFLAPPVPGQPRGMSLDAGYMSLVDSPLEVFACAGGDKNCPGPGLRGPGECDPAGVLTGDSIGCSSCTGDDFFAAGKCHNCEQSWISVVPLLVVLVAMCSCYYLYHKCNQDVTRVSMCKDLTLSYVQILVLLSSMDVLWPVPNWFMPLVHAAEIFEFDIEFTNYGYLFCFMPDTHLNQLIFQTLLPLFLCAALWADFALDRVARRLARRLALRGARQKARAEGAEERQEERQEEGKSELERLDTLDSHGTSRAMINVAELSGSRSVHHYRRDLRSLLSWFARQWFCQMEYALVWNTIGNLAKSLFIGMTQLAIALFVCQAHSPDHSKRTVSTLPGLVCQSDEWWKLVPLTATCILVYTVGVFCVILWVSWRAPKLSCNPAWREDFFKYFDFIVGNFRAGCWWWACVQTLYGLVINLATALIQAHATQLKIMIIATLLYTSFSAYFTPFKFEMANIMEVVVQYSLILLMIFGLSLVPLYPGQRYDQLVQDITERISFEVCIYFFFLAPFVTCTICICTYGWKKSDVVKTARHDLVFLHRMRDVMLYLGHHRISELHTFVAKMADYEVDSLRRAVNTVVAQDLKLQPSRNVAKQQLISDCPCYAVVTEELLDPLIADFLSARPQDRTQHLRAHELVARFARAMQSSVTWKVRRKSAKAQRAMMEGWFQAFDLDESASFSRKEFVRAARQVMGEKLSEAQLEELYSIFDVDGDESVSRVEFLAVLEHAMGQLPTDPDQHADSFTEAVALSRGAATSGTASDLRAAEKRRASGTSLESAGGASGLCEGAGEPASSAGEPGGPSAASCGQRAEAASGEAFAAEKADEPKSPIVAL